MSQDKNSNKKYPQYYNNRYMYNVFRGFFYATKSVFSLTGTNHLITISYDDQYLLGVRVFL